MSSKIHDSILEFDHALFSFKSHSTSSPLSLAHGLIFEVELFMFTAQHLPLFPYPSFTSFFLFLLYPFPACYPNPCHCIWMYIEE